MLISAIPDSLPAPLPGPVLYEVPEEVSLDEEDAGAVPLGGLPPEVLPGARGCLRAIVDILTGRRPALQLSRWAGPEVIHDLARLAGALRTSTPRPGTPLAVGHAQVCDVVLPWRDAVLPAGAVPPFSLDLRPQCHRDRLTYTAPRRLAAITARVQGAGPDWRCTHLGWLTAPVAPRTHRRGVRQPARDTA